MKARIEIYHICVEREELSTESCVFLLIWVGGTFCAPHVTWGNHDYLMYREWATYIGAHHNARRRSVHTALPADSGEMEQLKRLHLEGPSRRVSGANFMHQVVVAVFKTGINPT